MCEQIVFIVDDDNYVRDSVKELVESVGLKAKAFANAVDFLEQYDHSNAGCIVLDIRMARLSGLALQKKLNQMDSVIPIIFITAYKDISVVRDAFKGGAFDFISKPYHEQNLLDTINSALNVDAEYRIGAIEKEIFKRKAENLTAREQEVLALLVDGMSSKAAAKHLKISPRTVEVHRQRALAKIGTRSVINIKKHLFD